MQHGCVLKLPLSMPIIFSHLERNRSTTILISPVQSHWYLSVQLNEVVLYSQVQKSLCLLLPNLVVSVHVSAEAGQGGDLLLGTDSLKFHGTVLYCTVLLLCKLTVKID